MVTLSLPLSVLDALSLEPIRLFFSCDLKADYETVTKLAPFLMSIAPSWCCFGRPLAVPF